MLQRQQLEAAVELARESYATAKDDVQELGSGPNALELNQLEAAAELAHGKLLEAKLALAGLQSPADPGIDRISGGRRPSKPKPGAAGEKDVQAPLAMAKTSPWMRLCQVQTAEGITD